MKRLKLIGLLAITLLSSVMVGITALGDLNTGDEPVAQVQIQTVSMTGMTFNYSDTENQNDISDVIVPMGSWLRLKHGISAPQAGKL
jgi:hypothetical protein